MSELAHEATCLVCRARAEAPRRLLQGLALFAAGLCITTGLLNLRPAATHVRAAVPHVTLSTSAPAPGPGVKRGAEAHAAVAAAAALMRAHEIAASRLAADARRGADRGFFVSSPGGVFATAARVARWRPLVVRAARGSGFGPNLLEALVFVESSGRPDVSDGTAVGLTQLHPSVARRYGLHVDLRHSNRLTRQIAHTWGSRRAHQLRRRRARYDQRYAPARALHATVAYLEAARATLGRRDLALEAYHVGVKALRGAHVPYAQLYLRSQRVDDYGLRVLAAERVLKLWRHHPSALRFEAQQQARKNSAEEYLHPLYTTHRFASPKAILRARRHHVLRAIPLDARVTHIAVSGTLGAQARVLGRSRRLYRALRPQALNVLLYIGNRVHQLSGARRPLILTSAVRDNRYQRTLTRVNVNAARSYSLHTTGYAFDIARAYASGRQAAAFQFVLERLAAIDAIAYIRESAAIHIAVASDASRKLKLLESLH